MKFDIDPGYIFYKKMLVQFHSRKITVRDAIHCAGRDTPYMELIFPLFVICNVEKKLRRTLEVEETAI